MNTKEMEYKMDVSLGILWFISLTIWLIIEKNNPNNYLQIYGNSIILNYRNLNVSNFYRTEPIPKSNQPWYVNAAVEIKTNLKPKDIIEKLLFIENHFGRIRKKKNEPRVIDLDLLCYGNVKINNRNLIIPHPRLHIRKFVIKPICDINPLWKHPILKKKAINLLKGLANQKIFNINSEYGKSND